MQEKLENLRTYAIITAVCNFSNTLFECALTDRKNVTDFLYLVLHLACKVTCYFWQGIPIATLYSYLSILDFWLFSSVLVSVLRTSINVLSESKSRNYVTWIANLTKLFLSVLYKFGKIFHLYISTLQYVEPLGKHFKI